MTKHMYKIDKICIQKYSFPEDYVNKIYSRLK